MNFDPEKWAMNVGSVLSSAVSAYGQHSANAENQKMAREQMAFQERMSNTAYQRSVADMKAAGLNPLLAYGNQGASSPQGSMSTSGNVGANDFAHSARANVQYKALQSQIDLNKASAERERSASRLNDSNSVLSQFSAKHSEANLVESLNKAGVHSSVIGKYVLSPLSVFGSAVGNFFGGANSAKHFLSRR